MTQAELVNRILHLVPEASFSVHEVGDINIDEDRVHYKRAGYMVAWAASNVSPCPSAQAINAVNLGE